MIPGTGEGSGGQVTLRFWAAAREAAGQEQEASSEHTLAAALAGSVRRRGPLGPALERVLARCSFLVDGAPVGTRDPAAIELAPGSTVDVLPPFAGG